MSRPAASRDSSGGTAPLDVSLDYMRQQYRRVTIGFATPPEVEFRIPGIEQVRTSGRQVELLVSRNIDAVVAEVRHAFPASLEVRPVGLRDLFLARVRTPNHEAA